MICSEKDEGTHTTEDERKKSGLRKREKRVRQNGLQHSRSCTEALGF